MPARGEEGTPTLRSTAPAESVRTGVTEALKRDHLPDVDSAEFEPQGKKRKEACPRSAKEPSTSAKANEDSTLEDNTADIATNVAREPVETVDEVILRVSSETSKLLAKFQEHFSESEGFELFCPTRLDEMLKQARILEENYVEQRRKLRERLTKTLQML